MFAQRYPNGVPESGALQGTRFNGVWKGPPGAGFLGGLFVTEAQKAERAAHDRLNTGNQGHLGVGSIYVPGVQAYPEPGTGRLVEPADSQGRFHVINSQWIDDQAAMINEKRKWAERAFSSWFVDDAILKQCTSKEFYEACAATNGIKGMPAELVAASATPSVLNYFPTDSSQYSLGAAKAVYLIQHHPDARGRMFTGGRGSAVDTHKEHPRSARSALEDAVA